MKLRKQCINKMNKMCLTKKEKPFKKKKKILELKKSIETFNSTLNKTEEKTMKKS